MKSNHVGCGYPRLLLAGLHTVLCDTSLFYIARDPSLYFMLYAYSHVSHILVVYDSPVPPVEYFTRDLRLLCQ
jgi:hypothetical protein